MKTIPYIILSVILMSMEEFSFAQQKNQYNDLSQEEVKVIVKKGTELPFTGIYYDFDKKGTYLCKRCGSALYYSDFKFESSCGWPSFDDEIGDAVKRVADADGYRIEIQCASCGAHLGHVFTGEGLTKKNTRHCVNSASLDFVPAQIPTGQYGTAVFAGGCFWGVEFYMQKEPGVVSVVSGFTGGAVKNPSYREVCTGSTGHAEAVKITYDLTKTDYETLLKLFLEIHDPTQAGGQGPDIGDQYRSEIFYLNSEQRIVAEKCISTLREKGLNVVTEITRASDFYIAEDYHQDYYFRNGKMPYCHSRVPRF